MAVQLKNSKAFARTACSALLFAGTAPLSLAYAQAQTAPATGNPWMAPAIVAKQNAATTDEAREAVAERRAQLLLKAMTLPQKMQQLTGSRPEQVAELPQCFGARHVTSIPELQIPTFRITNGPVGVGQNDCVDGKFFTGASRQGGIMSRSLNPYTHPSSAKATALPSALGVAASFDPQVAHLYGDVIGTEMNNLALHVFEAPGLNLARLPILGRNFEYFGEDPFLSGTMGVAETQSVQSHGLIAMPKHYVANEQETNRQTIQTTVAQQVLRELYYLPFEMAVKDGKASSIMCAYNYVNALSSCSNPEILTNVLRKDWGFTGYVQTDFYAMKSAVEPLKAGMDHEMPMPSHWTPKNLTAALDSGKITLADINLALERRYRHMFKRGIFDRAIVQTPIDFAAGGQKAREIGGKSLVLLQNNGALPLRRDVRSVVLIGKATQVYAQQAVAGGALTGQPLGSGGGSSDVVPEYTVSPIEGLRNALKTVGNSQASVKLILVDDQNETATIDGTSVPFAAALAEATKAESVVIMAGTIAEEGADRATFTTAGGRELAGSAAAGMGLDWYADMSNVISTTSPRNNPGKNSQTTAMIKAVLRAKSASGRTMAQKTALVLKDNASISVDPALVGVRGPSIVEAWFPGQEDGNIVADVLFGLRNPSGKLPVTFPYAGKSFLDHATPQQFPGAPAADGKQTVTYSEGLAIGYRWYDANLSGKCGVVRGTNPCVAFPFGHGLSYTTFTVGRPVFAANPAGHTYRAKVRVTNTGKVAGTEVVQAYVSLPAGANAVGAPQPPKRLVGFQRVELAPGASQDVELIVDAAASNHPISVWNEAEHKWIVPSGTFTLWVGRSSSPRDLVKAGTFAH